MAPPPEALLSLKFSLKQLQLGVNLGVNMILNANHFYIFQMLNIINLFPPAPPTSLPRMSEEVSKLAE